MSTQHCLNIVSVLVQGTGERHCHNIHTMLPAFFHNVSHHNVEQCCHNVRQHCLNLVSTFSLSVGVWHGHNGHTALPETLSQCQFLIFRSKISTIYTQYWYIVGQHCDIVVVMLRLWSKYNFGTMFTQCCLDIDTLLECLKVSTNEREDNIGTIILTKFKPMLRQCCHNIWAIAG